LWLQPGEYIGLCLFSCRFDPERIHGQQGVPMPASIVATRPNVTNAHRSTYRRTPWRAGKPIVGFRCTRNGSPH
jgi:hypothetical protein